MKTRLYLLLSSALLFVLLFHEKGVGINLFIFELATVTALYYLKRKEVNTLVYIFIGATLFSAAAFAYHGSMLSIWANILSFIIVISLLYYPHFKNILNAILLSARNILYAPIQLIKRPIERDHPSQKRKRKFSHFIIPILVIVVFAWLYSLASPYFAQLTDQFLNGLEELISLLPRINWGLIGTLLLGVIISSFIFYSTLDQYLISVDQKIDDTLHRFKKHSFFKFLDLKREYQAGVFLLIVLNIFIGIVNLTDIWNVWINFNWSGDLLKEFVHKGTYVLIISIVISIIIIAYFFRGNLNFYSGNKKLKQLTYIWIVQNMILVLCVAARNLRYIEHFSLAYKRIAVFFFLAAALVGLLTIILKVHQRKSLDFLVRFNVLSSILIFIFMGFFDWSMIITKYNLKHIDKGYVEMAYMSRMPDRCLPLLQKPIEEWQKLHQIQEEKFPLKRGDMDPERFHEIIDNRIELFLTNQEKRHWLEKSIQDRKAVTLLHQ